MIYNENKNVYFVKPAGDLLNYKIGYYGKVTYRQPLYYISIYDWIEISKREKWKNIIHQAREHRRNGDNEGYSSLKQTLPCTMFTCHTSTSKTLTSLSDLLPFIVIDVDHINEDDIENVKAKLFELPYVILSSTSVSGCGVWALAYIKHPDKAKETYRALSLELAKIGVIIDKQCNNINRLRFLSYDEHLLVKAPDTAIQPYDRFIEERKKVISDDTKRPLSKILGPTGYTISWTKKDDIEDIYIEHSDRWRLFNSLSRITKDEIEFRKEWESCCDHILERNGHTTQYYKDLFDNSDWGKKLTGKEYIDRDLLEKFGYIIKFTPN